MGGMLDLVLPSLCYSEEEAANGKGLVTCEVQDVISKGPVSAYFPLFHIWEKRMATLNAHQVPCT